MSSKPISKKQTPSSVLPLLLPLLRPSSRRIDESGKRTNEKAKGGKKEEEEEERRPNGNEGRERERETQLENSQIIGTLIKGNRRLGWAEGGAVGGRRTHKERYAAEAEQTSSIFF